MITSCKTNWSGGVFSPLFWGRFEYDRYSTAARQIRNAVPMISGALRKRNGLQYVAEIKDSTAKVKLVRFQFSQDQAYILEWGNKYVRFFTVNGEVVTTGMPGAAPYEVVTPYTTEDLPLLDVSNQSADVLYCMHPSYPPATLSRYSQKDWKYAVIDFKAKIAAPTNLKRSSGTGKDCKYSVTALNDAQEESTASNVVEGGPGDTFTWNTVTDATQYNIYKDDAECGDYGWIAKATTNTFKEISNGITPDYTKTPPIYKNPFDGKDKYPSTSAFFQQRLLFAGTNKKPQTIWGSVSGSFYNMNVSSPIREDDSFSFTINAKDVNIIQWLAPLNDIIIGTYGNEWRMRGGGLLISR